MDNSKIGHHISEQFNKELEDVRNKVLAMGGLVEQQLELAIEALITGNVEQAEFVIGQDGQIDMLEVAIELECTQILALRQPTAFDLRLLLAVIKIVHELERIGNKAKRISEMAVKLSSHTNSMPKHDMDRMVELVKAMLDNALDAFARMSIEEIPAITERDQKVDREYENIVRLLITHMMEDPRNITRFLDVLTTVRALERVGDHARYICEHLVFMIKGENVRHLTQEELVDKINTPR
jgi:phosphate transport system protein